MGLRATAEHGVRLVKSRLDSGDFRSDGSSLAAHFLDSGIEVKVWM